MRKKVVSVLLALTLLTGIAAKDIQADSAPRYNADIVSLRTNSLKNPLTVDDDSPSFSWQLDSNLIGQSQTAYQVKVLNEDSGETVWDSGKVEDRKSTYIYYPETAKKLEPQTTYSWIVTVWDALDKELTSEKAYFSTGLMSESLDAWKGANWIGPDEVALDAASLPVYRMEYSMKLEEGSTGAGFIFGADDPRYANEIHNNHLITGENYILYELDVTGENAAVNVYRVGYCADDQKDVPIVSMDVSSIITEENKYGEHTFEIVISGNEMESLSIDGSDPVVTGAETNAYTGAETEVTNLALNPEENTLYPRLNNIGFYTNEDSKAVFSDICVRNYKLPQAALFGYNLNAGYEIFEDLQNVSVNGSKIEVDENVLAYADPSYGALPMLRKDINADKTIYSAVLYATARGVYEFYINGERVGEDYFAPGDSDYRQQIQYTSYDVTDMLNSGSNALGAILGSGWFSDAVSFNLTNHNFYGDRQSLLALLEITYTDGTTEQIVTDDSWQYYGEGPIRYAGFFNGETYDATLEGNVDGWAETGYDASEWRAAQIMQDTVSDVVNGQLVDYEPRITAKVDSAVQEVEVLDAAYVSTEVRGGHTVYIYDMGTNMVGIPSITLPEGEAGQKIVIRFAESLYPELDAGNEYHYGDLANLMLTENYRTALSTDTYIMKGTPGGETYTPSFTFHGYQYIEISGVDQMIPQENIKGIVLSSITEAASTYETSNELTNQLYDNIMRSTYGNHLSIATDCPQRDERLGWSGDAQVYSRTATYMADMNAFYDNFTSLMRDGQNKTTGVYAMFSPSFNPVDEGSNLGYCWSAAGVIVPYETYLQYGDITILEENYDSMKLHHSYLMQRHLSGKEYLTSETGFLADHLSVDTTNTAMLANATFYYTMSAMAHISEILGYESDADTYSAFAEGIKSEWNETYVDPDTHRTDDNTQASYSLPLEYDVFDEVNKPYAQQYLTEACEVTGYTITTGFVGTAPLLPALTSAGNIDDAYAMFEQTELASWLYPVTQGATSIWERWNSYSHVEGYGGQNGMNSFNHYSLGAVGAWMMAYQAGIQRDDEAGFQSFILQPTPGGSFTYTNASYDSSYGTIVSNWTADEGAIQTYQTVVPANTNAVLYLPAEIEELEFKDIEGVTFVGITEHNGQTAAEFEVAAGGYEFIINESGITAEVSDGYVTKDGGTDPAETDETTETKDTSETGETKATEETSETGETKVTEQTDETEETKDTNGVQESDDTKDGQETSSESGTGAKTGKTGTPKTGDSAPLLILAMCVLGTAAVIVSGKKRNSMK